jgi:hypothetical protein
LTCGKRTTTLGRMTLGMRSTPLMSRKLLITPSRLWVKLLGISEIKSCLVF